MVSRSEDSNKESKKDSKDPNDLLHMTRSVHRLEKEKRAMAKKINELQNRLRRQENSLRVQTMHVENEDHDKNARMGVLSQIDKYMPNVDEDDEVRHVPQTKGRFRNPRSRKVQCSRYKARVRPCLSKRKMRVIPEEKEKEEEKEEEKREQKRRRVNPKKGEFPIDCTKKSYVEVGPEMWISGDGMFVHSSHFGRDIIRELQSDQVIPYLMGMAMCQCCAKGYGSSKTTYEYVDIVRRTQCCTLCKKYGNMVGKNGSMNQIPICPNCVELRKGYKGHERQLAAAMEYLKYIYPDNYVMIEMNKQTGRNKDHDGKVLNTSRFADCVLTFEEGEYLGVVIIECDEDEHSSYNSADETNKFTQQTKEIVRMNMTAWKNKDANHDVRNVKTLFLRYNPNTPYKDSGEERNLTPEARLMIIRQQIIAWKRKIKEVRMFVVMYAFMNSERVRRWYPINEKYKGCGLVYNCPCPEKGMTDWYYCADVNEQCTRSTLTQQNSLLATLQRQRVKWSDTFKDNSWKNEDKVTERFPTLIYNDLSKLFPILLE